METKRRIPFILVLLCLSWDQVYPQEYNDGDEFDLTNECGSNPLDLVLLVDTSDANNANYDREVRNFLSEFVEYADVNSGAVRVALVTFSTGVQIEFRLGEIDNIAGIQKAIRNVPFTPGDRNTADALEMLRRGIFFEPYGDRPDAPNALIIITSGNSNRNTGRTVPQAEALHQGGVSILVIGIGVQDEEETNGMASSPANENTFYLQSIDELSIIQDLVFVQLCAPGDALDLIFLFHFSNDMSEENFRYILSYVSGLLIGADIDNGNVRVGAALYRHDGVPLFQLNQYQRKEDIINAIENIPYNYRSARASLSAGIETVRTNMFQRQAGDRDEAPNGLILITDSTSNINVNKVANEAESLHNAGVTVFGIGIGLRSTDEVRTVVSANDNTYLMRNVNQLPALTGRLQDRIPALKAILPQPTEAPTPATEPEPEPTTAAPEVITVMEPTTIENSDIADVLVVFHSSHKTKAKDFNRNLKPFLSDIFAKAKIEPNKVRVAVVNYGNRVNSLFNFNTHTTKQKARGAIRKIKARLRHSKSNLGATLRHIRTQEFSQRSGSRISQGVPGAIILVTDMPSDSGTIDALDEAELLKRSGISILTVGIGDADRSELSAISSKPEYAQYVPNYATLKSNINILENIKDTVYALQGPNSRKPPPTAIVVRTAQPIPETTLAPERVTPMVPVLPLADSEEADIVVAVHSSRSTSEDDFSKLKTYLKSLFAKADVNSGKVQISCIVYGRDARTIFYLNQYNTSQQVSEAIDRISPRMRDNIVDSSAALVRAREMFGYGARATVPKALFMITDSASTVKTSTVENQKALLQGDGVDIFSIGVGIRDKSELELLSTSPNNIYNVQGYGQLAGNAEELRNRVYALNTAPAPPVVTVLPGTPGPIERITPSRETGTVGPPIKITFPSPTVECKAEVDLVIIIDSSTSVGPDNYEKTKTFVMDLLRNAEIDSGLVRVGIVTYSTNVDVRFNLNTYSTKTQIFDAIQNIEYTYGSTNTAGAIGRMRNTMFTTANGDRPNVPNVAIIITDGVSNINARETIPEAEAARKANIHIYAIGIGLADTTELDQMASIPIDDNRFTVQTFDELKGFDQKIFSAICRVATPDLIQVPVTPAPPQTECGLAKVDLVFVLDSSTSVGQDNYDKMLNFLKDFLRNADIDSGSIRVGVVSYSTGVHLEFKMNDYTTQQEVFNAIDNIPYRYGSTNTADGLRKMHNEMFTARNGDREDVPNIAIVITDGVSNINSRRTIPESNAAKKKGIHVYVIGIGLTDTREIFAMATAPASENAFTITGFDELRGLDEQIFSAICPGQRKQTTPTLPATEPPPEPIDGGFSTWADWGPCSVTCGVGYTRRSRQCNNPSPQFGGANCVGDYREQISCELDPCPIDGGFSRWSDWSICSATCGRGISTRTRSCDSPAPQYGGQDCNGEREEQKQCMIQECQECGLAKVDLVFVLDSSTSVGQDNYDKMLKFLKDFLSNADIDSGSIRVGVVSYSTGVHVEFQMNDFTTQLEVFNAIDNIPYRYGSTNTADGLRKMHDEMFTAANGDRDGVPNIAIVITDGVSNINSRRTIPEADAAKGKGIHVYVIGIGLKDTREIFAMATAPASENAFTVTGFDELRGLDEQIFSAICPVSTPSPSGYDLVVVLDSSVNRETFQWMTDFVKSLTSQLNIDGGDFRVGVMRYSSTADVQFNLKDYTTQAEMAPAIDVIDYKHGETDTAKAFEAVRTRMFRAEKGDRDFARNYILYLTGNERSLNTDKIWREAERVEDDDIGIFVVGINTDETTEIDETSTHPLSQYRFLVRGRRELMEIPGQLDYRIREMPDVPPRDWPRQRPINGGFSTWAQWESCSVTCGIGIRTRTRECNNPVPQFGGADCDGEFEEFESCESVPCPIDGGFSRWSDWSQCSKTCGLGTKTRQRSCDNPAPQYGGRDCAGILEETTECQLEKCQVTIPPPTSECGLAKVDLVFVLDSSTSVGQDNYNKMMNFLKDFLTNADIDSGSIRVGVVSYSTGVHVEFQLNDYTTQQEVFDAIDNIPYRYGSTNTADGLLRMHSQMFTARNGDRDDAPNIAIVITDGVSNINSRRTIPEADRAKEKGIHVYIIGIGLTDTREIFAMATAPASENAFTVTGFDELKGLDQQIFSAICPVTEAPPEPIDGGFSTWTEWDVCSATCGEGIKTRTRECNNPTPQFGGRDCEGDLEEFAACEIIPCPIDGGLSRWSEWTECSQTCGLGTKSRQRSCDSPTPQYGGRDCYGATVETTECQLEPCQVPVTLPPPVSECGLAKVDLVFVLDSSTSVGQDNYNKMLNFLKEFLTNANIDSGSIRVGVVSYSTGVHVEFQMNDYTTQQEVFNAIDNIPYRYGSTNTADGLRKMHNEMFTAKNGDRDGVPNIAIVITDGVSNINSRRTIPEADAAKGKGIHVYVIGIGLTDTREIYAMATAPASENAFTVTGFDELTGLDERIFSAICPVSTPAPTAYDLVIVMDSSVNRRTYRWMLAFVKNLTGQLNIDNGEFRVGLLRYSTSADVQFNLEDYTTRNDINPAVDLVQYQPGETNTAKAFETVRTQMFRPNKGDRDYARNYILLLTGNEESLDTNEIWREAERVEDEDIGIFVVGIGLNDTREVDETSTHPLSKYRYLVSTRGQLLKIPGQIENTITGMPDSPPNDWPRPRPRITEPPPIDGGFSTWSDWGQCSKTCGEGIKTRVRFCNSPAPQFGGLDCVGSTEESMNCQLEPCQVPVTLPPQVSECGLAKVDLVFVLDSSTSVGQDNYDKMLNFLKDFLKNADINSGSIRVGVVSYSTGVHVEFQLNDFTTQQDVFDAIDNIPYRYGSTNTADGLLKMHGEMFTARNGDRDGVPNIAIVITDGVSNINSRRTIPEADAAKGNGIHVYVIGIGLTDTREIFAMATAPASENAFTVTGFDELRGLDEQIFSAICPGTKPPPIDGGYSSWTEWTPCSKTCGQGTKSRQRFCNSPLPQNGGRDCLAAAEETVECQLEPCQECGLAKVDLVFILDSSTSVGQGNYNKMLNFLKEFLTNADIDSGSIRVGVVSYSTGVHLEFQLNDYTTQQEVFNAIDNIPYRYGSTNTADGLLKMHNEMFTARNGDRDGVPNIAIVITDGVSNINSRRTIPEADAAKGKGIHVYVIGIGLTDTREIFAMATAPASENAFTVTGFDELRGLDEQIFSAICPGTEAPPTPIDGGFTEWTQWTKCTASCDGGITTRTRDCTNQRPQFGGKDCEGPDSDVKICGMQSCPIDGGFSTWSEWGQCSATCGKGFKDRQRLCDSPAPQNGGRDCEGSRVEKMSCQLEPCQVPVTLPPPVSECGLAKVDLVFILDSSTSVGQDNYNKMLNFLKEFLTNADIDSGSIRVGVVSYSTGVHVEFQMNDFTTQQEVFDAIDNIPYRYGSTNTADGLLKMHDEMFTARNGDRDGVPNIAIVITDGVSNINSRRTIPEADAAKGKGIHVYVIGIGLTDTREIFAMATAPASENAFTVTGFDELRGLDEQIFSAICPGTESPPIDGGFSTWTPWGPCSVTCGPGVMRRRRQCDNPIPQNGGRKCTGPRREEQSCNLAECVVSTPPPVSECDGQVDLVIIVDSSTSVGQENFDKTLQFCKDFLNNADIDSGNVRVGLVTYSTEVKVHFNLNSYTSKADVFTAIDYIPYLYGSTNTAGGLETMRSEMFTARNGDRPGAKNIAMIVTDGVSNINSRRTIPEAIQARDEGIHIYAVGIGLTDTRELDGMASEPIENNRFVVADFDELAGLDEQVFAALCPGTQPPTPEPSAYDLVIILDSSVNRQTYQWMLDFSKRLTRQLNIDGGEYRVGVLRYSTNADVQFNLNDHLNQRQIRPAIDRIQHRPGQTNTAKAFETVRTQMFRPERGDRPYARNYILLLTGNEKSLDTNEIWREAERVEDDDIGIFVVGINTDDTSEIDETSTHPLLQYRYLVRSRGDLLKLPRQLDNTIRGMPDNPPSDWPRRRPRLTTTTMAPTTTTPKPTGYDLVIVLDSSVTPEIYQWMLNFAKRLTNQLNVDGGEYRVGVMSYSTYANVQFNLDDHLTQSRLSPAIERIQYRPGETNTAKALETVRTRMFRHSEGDRDYARNFILLLTGNEESLSTNDAWAAAERAEDDGIGIYVIGIDINNTNEIDEVASHPLSEYRFLVRRESDFMEIPGQMDFRLHKMPERPPRQWPRRRPRLTTPAPTRRPLPRPEKCTSVGDIVFILDSSGSVGRDNFYNVLNFTYNTVDELDIDTGHYRIGVITFSDNARTEFRLDRYNNKRDIERALTQVRYIYGSTHTAAALRLARTELFQPNGDRPDVPNVIVIVTDGESNINHLETIPEAMILKRSGVSIITVAIGFTDRSSELIGLTSPPITENLIRVESFDSLDRLKDKLVAPLCTDTDMCSPNPCQNGGRCIDGLRSYVCQCAEGFHGENCNKRCGEPADVVFVLDSSNTVGRETFRRMKSYAEQLVTEMDVEVCDIRIGVMKYSSRSMVQFHVGAYRDTDTINRVIDSVSYTRGRANMAGAFNTLRRRMFHGNGDRTNVRNIAYILTDGSTDINAGNTMQEAELAIQSGIYIVPVGVSLRERGEVESIALSQGTNTIEIDSEDTFMTMRDEVLRPIFDLTDHCATNPCKHGGTCRNGGNGYTCSCVPGFTGDRCQKRCDAQGDIVFAVDTSRYSTRKELRRVKRFLRSLVKRMSFKRQGFRVGIVEYNSNAKVSLTFQNGRKKKAALAAVSGIRSRGGDPDPTEALRKAHLRIFDNEDRRNVPNYLIFVTKSMNNENNVIREANKLKVAGARIIGVGIGLTTSEKEFLSSAVSSPIPSYMYNVPNVQGLNDVADSIMTMLCDERNMCESDPCGNRGECIPTPGSYYCQCRPGYAGKTCQKACNAKADVAFLLDSSGSVGQKNFQKIKNFLIHMVDDMTIGFDATRVGVASFSDTARLAFYMDQYMTKEEVRRAISGVDYEYGNTNTASGIKLARNHILDPKRGDRKDVQNFLIIITDGLSNINAENTLKEAELAKEEGTHVISIGIGSFDPFEINAMATEPASKNAFIIDDFDRLFNISDKLVSATCRDPSVCDENPCRNGGVCTPLINGYKCKCKNGYRGTNCESACQSKKDIVFVLDSSSSVGEVNFQQMLNFVKALIEELSAPGTNNRFGLVTYSTEPNLIFSLGRYTDPGTVSTAVATTRYTPGSTNTAGGLRTAMEIFTNNYGNRRDADDVVILVTDGESNVQAYNTIPSADELKRNNIKIISIGIGIRDSDEITRIASSTDDVFQVGGFESLSGVKTDILDTSCKRNEE